MTLHDKLFALIGCIFAVGYLAVMNCELPPYALMSIKGAGIGALALAAMLAARNLDGWLLAAFFALGSAGDMLVINDLTYGGAAFALGHIAAITLFLRNHRAPKTMPLSQKAAAFAILLSAPLIYLLAGKADIAMALYAILLVVMAAAAWTSRFSRYRTGIGALLFVLSDALIFAEIGGKIDAETAGYLIWPTYFVGQLLIFAGVRQYFSRTT